MGPLPEHLSSIRAGRQQLSRKVVASHQRERVLGPAIEVFAKRGYRGTTVDHIVEAAGIGVGSFYELFDNKEDCFLHCYERVVDSARERIATRVPAGTPWPEAARSALLALLKLIEAEPLAARLALIEVQTAGPAALARYEETLDDAAPFLASGREVSPNAAELPAHLEQAVLGGLAWFLHQRVALGEFAGAEAHLGDALAILVEPYLGEAATAALAAEGTSPLAAH